MIGVVVALSCSARTAADEEDACETPRVVAPSCDVIRDCVGCFQIDPSTGRGRCQGTVHDISHEEMVAVLGATAITDERWKTECPERDEFLPILADLAMEHAEDYDVSYDLMQRLAAGVDGRQLLVRITHRCVEEQPVIGLSGLLTVALQTDAPTCCIGPECEGADFSCAWSADEGLPTRCVATPPG